jgi:ATP-binding cassette subfamily G (WHITE) protein 2 (PDR)
MVIYFIATELNSTTTSTAEVLVFRRGHVPKYMQGNPENGAADVEKGAEAGTKEGAPSDTVNVLAPQKDLFTWTDVVYDIQIKGETRRLLDHVSGWVKPGTLTALST